MAQPKLHVRLKPAAEQVVRRGHPWIFDESIQEQSRAGETGELAIVYDRQDRFLAIGFYDAQSPIRIRVLHAGKPVALDDSWWQSRIDEAKSIRAAFDSDTTGYRCLYGESEGFPGLVLDRYADNLVLKLYSAVWKPRLEWLKNLIVRNYQPARLVLRLSKNIEDAFAKDGISGATVLEGSPLDGAVSFRENGLKFEADLLHGQKTGFFLDQRENRAEIGRLAKGRTVLNAFSYSGGFSLYAARAGARGVTDVDMSEQALQASRHHFEINAPGLPDRCGHETIRADVFEWFKDNSRARQFGVVIVDPPALARKKSEKLGALRAYQRLIESGLQMTSPNGILVAASCTAHVPAEEFFEIVEAACRRSGRRFDLLKKTGHPVDHPVRFPEAGYLKAMYVRLTS